MVAFAFDMLVEGTGAPTDTGLTITFLDTVPVKTTSGVTVVDYRVSNSKGNTVQFNSIAAKIYGDSRTKYSVALGHSSLSIGAGSSQDSTITITTSSNILQGEISKIVVTGDAVDV